MATVHRARLVRRRQIHSGDPLRSGDRRRRPAAAGRGRAGQPAHPLDEQWEAVLTHVPGPAPGRARLLRVGGSRRRNAPCPPNGRFGPPFKASTYPADMTPSATEGVRVPLDRTEHSRAGRRLAVLRSLSRILSEPTDIAITTPMILETLCLELGWDVGTLWVIDPGAETLRSVGSWHHPRLAPRNYSGPLSGVRLPPGVGLPGRVWAQRSAQWGMDLDDAQRTSAMVAGLVSAVGFPIRSGDELVGVVELQSGQHEPPDEDLVELLESAGALIAQTLQRDRALRLLHEADVRYRALVERLVAIVYIGVVDESMPTSYVSPQITTLLGVTPEEYISDP